MPSYALRELNVLEEIFGGERDSKHSDMDIHGGGNSRVRMTFRLRKYVRLSHFRFIIVP